VKKKCKKCERNKSRTVRKKLNGIVIFIFEDNKIYYALVSYNLVMKHAIHWYCVFLWI